MQGAIARREIVRNQKRQLIADNYNSFLNNLFLFTTEKDYPEYKEFDFMKR
jgi:hypothetical protein